MTSRWLKDDEDKLIFGKNGKKLRYLFYKKTGYVQTTFDNNWKEDAIKLLEERFPEKVERVQKIRGRPKKEKIEQIEQIEQIEKVERVDKKTVKRKKEKLIKNTAATIDTSDEEEMFDIDGFQVVLEDGKSCYKNKKDWVFDQDGIYIGHYHNGQYINL